MESVWQRILVVTVCLMAAGAAGAAEDDLHFWLDNMIRHHNYALDEMVAATGLPREKIEQTARQLGITRQPRPQRNAGKPLLVLPYPGGRHPRIGFLDGAIDPMRGTKFSVFLPWPDAGYIVVDLPEAIWSNLGLTFLAHTHIPTIWDEKGVKLEDVEWTRNPDGSLEERRTLPNGIAFGMRVVPRPEAVDVELSLRNGTDAPLSQLRAQVCIMLKGAPAFNEQSHDNKTLFEEVACARSTDGKRWIATAWDRGKPWENPPVPCIHSDPHFPDCAPGNTVTARGRIFFFDGEDIKGEIQRRRKAGELHWKP
jgi:hypothetical protein